MCRRLLLTQFKSGTAPGDLAATLPARLLLTGVCPILVQQDGTAEQDDRLQGDQQRRQTRGQSRVDLRQERQIQSRRHGGSQRTLPGSTEPPAETQSDRQPDQQDIHHQAKHRHVTTPHFILYRHSAVAEHLFCFYYSAFFEKCKTFFKKIEKMFDFFEKWLARVGGKGKNAMWKKKIGYCLLGIGVPLTVIGGAILFPTRAHAWVSLCAVLLACVPVFWRFEFHRPESRRADTAELVIVAVMTATAVAGRILFAAWPSVKPVAAVVIIVGLYFGAEDGFLVGALTAVISNMYFGQGMWTPFQMLGWGLVGGLAGLLARPLKRHWWLMAIYAVLSGVLYSLIMDVWTVLWFGQGFPLSRYIAAITVSLPETATYAVSNLVFLMPLYWPLGRVFARIRLKYGL